jgi:ribosomal protein S17E
MDTGGIGMNVLNYHPEVIEKEFEELKSNVEKINVNAKKKFKTRILLLILICIIT